MTRRTVILAYRKMLDDASDERGFRALRRRIGAALLRRSYRRAAARQSGFDENTTRCLDCLAAVEKSGGASLDEAADGFAQLLAFPASRTADETQRRVQSEILYHIGRAVYILDAADDYASDRKNGRYNPLCRRFSGETMAPEEMNAAALLPDGAWKPILENILSCGVPHTADAVFAGTWKKNRKHTERL